ncbi:MAG: serine/threonine protein kinase, partial [Planctomycetia bacterium]|nr:serine/threonine protein kinase [Planctomycetia bacterium]
LFRHPGIVAVYGLGRTPGGGYFIVMELVEGPDLSQAAAGRAVPVADAVRWTIAAAGAIAHAHERGIVHCDLKPSNLLLDRDGRLRVTDFGLARSLADDAAAGQIEGTAPFMAPEQVSGYWGTIGPRTDVYGLGAVLYTLLSGEPPSRGHRVPDLLAQVVSRTPIAALDTLREHVPASLVRVCERCLSKSSGDRFGSAMELRQALEAVV